MQPYQKDFIEFALKYNVLRFGEFILKSGRKSPYFFNAGLFDDGSALSKLGKFYAQAIQQSGIEFDMLFGPAYKGIALSVATAITLNDEYQRNTPVAFNRKESKAYGEKGTIIGAPLQGQVLIIDDVISAGTTIRESVEIITAQSAQPKGVVIAMDRQERGQTELSAIEEAEQRYHLQVIPIITLTDLINYLESHDFNAETIAAMLRYKKEYGSKTAD
jgi:orotate phosphoribosyltransferase